MLAVDFGKVFSMLTHANEIKKLTPDDFAIIEHEHLRLARYMEKIHETCSYIVSEHVCNDCGREKQASCSGRLTSFLIDIVNIAEEHFVHEEQIMLNRSANVAKSTSFIAHKTAHYKILLQIESLAEISHQFDKAGKTIEAYRYLYQQLTDIFSAHDIEFDDPFIQFARAEL